MKLRLSTETRDRIGHEPFWGSANLLGNHVAPSTMAEGAKKKVQEEVEYVFTVL